MKAKISYAKITQIFRSSSGVDTHGRRHDDRCTGFVMGYALVEYENFEEAHKAINEMDGTELLTQTTHLAKVHSRGGMQGDHLEVIVQEVQGGMMV
nr:RNA-binding protein 8A-like [Ipomoea batatas]